MSNYLSLTKVQIFTLFPKGKKQNRSMILLGLLYFGLAVLIAIYSIMISLVLCIMEAADVIPAFLYTIISVIILITTVLKTSGLLFNNRDYELLTSLPIKTGTLIASRLTAIYLFNLFFAVSIMLPALLPIIFIKTPGILFCILYLLSIFFVPLFPIAVSTFIGIVISFAASRFRHKNIVTMILSFAALFLVLYFSMTISNVSPDNFEKFDAAFIEISNRFYPPAAVFGGIFNPDGVNIVYFILFLIMSAGSISVTIAILAPFYKKIYTSLTARTTKSNYVYHTSKLNSPFTAIYKKELRRYTGCSSYVVNTAFSPLFALAFAILTCFVPFENIANSFAGGIGDITAYIPAVIPYIAGLILSMAPTTAAVISLEGRALWITQTLPIKPSVNLNAKMLVNLTLTVPAAFISSVIFKFSLNFSITEALLTFLVMLSFTLLSTTLGLLLNILSPNFTWVNEAAVVKQSLPVAVTLFAILFVGIACIIATIVLPLPYYVTQLLVAAALIGISALLTSLSYRIKIKD